MTYTLRLIRFASSVFLIAVLLGCASGTDKLKPTDLGVNPALVSVRSVWSAKIGMVDFPMVVKVNDSTVTLASSDGVVAALDARTGADIWRFNVGSPIVAGVGSDGRYAAVVTRTNELVILDGGRELWRTRLLSQVFTVPLVAGGRIFVLGADRSVAAYDGQSGRRLWQNQRPGEALVLRQTGVLLAIGNTLVAGVAGRLVGLNPLNGNTVWDASLATSRGTNDVERLVDLVGGVSRLGNILCVRAFQSAVGCVDAVRGSLIWKRLASGSVGLSGDDKLVYGVESDAKVVAWRREDGTPAWESDRLRYRELTLPLDTGRSLAIGDESGLIHFLSRSDGSILTRIATDGSAIKTAPVLVSGTMVVVTRNGGVFGFLPE